MVGCGWSNPFDDNIPYKTRFEDGLEFFEDEKQNQIWFETIINKELIQQILSYGKDVEVLDPMELKKELKIQAESFLS